MRGMKQIFGGHSGMWDWARGESVTHAIRVLAGCKGKRERRTYTILKRFHV